MKHLSDRRIAVCLLGTFIAAAVARGEQSVNPPGVAELRKGSIVARLEEGKFAFSWTARSKLYPGGYNSAAPAVLGKEAAENALAAHADFPNSIVDLTDEGSMKQSGGSARIVERRQLHNMTSQAIDIIDSVEVIQGGIYRRLSTESLQQAGEIRLATPLAPEINQRESVPAWLAVTSAYLDHGGFTTGEMIATSEGGHWIRCTAGSSEAMPDQGKTRMSSPMEFFLDADHGHRLVRYVLYGFDGRPVIVCDLKWEASNGAIDLPSSAEMRIWQGERLCEEIIVSYVDWQTGESVAANDDDFSLDFPPGIQVHDQIRQALAAEVETWLELAGYPDPRRP